MNRTVVNNRFKDDGMIERLQQITLPDGTRFWCLRPAEVRVIHDSVNEYFRHGIDLRPGDVVFDVGANIGLFAHHVQRLATCGVHVYSFEPIPQVFAALQANAQQALDADWHVFPLGLGRADETVTFRYHFRASMLSTAYPDKSPAEQRRWLETVARNLHRAPWSVRWLAWLPRSLRDPLLELGIRKLLKSHKVACQLRRLSHVVAEQGIERIDLLKIDVERGELDVLAGIDPQDWPKIQQVVVEVHDLEQGRVDQVVQLLRSQGFDQLTVEQEPMLDQTDMFNVFARRSNRDACASRAA